MKENKAEHISCSYEMAYPEPWEKDLISGAVDLVNHFSKAGYMLPTTLDHYTKLAFKGSLLVAKTDLNKVIGTVAITQNYDNGVSEFGGWAISEYYQHKGIGIKLALELLSNYHYLPVIAFGNKNSAPILEAMGAIIVKDQSVLPKQAFDLCSTCPKKPKMGCCDIIYYLDPIIVTISGKKNSHIKPIILGL